MDLTGQRRNHLFISFHFFELAENFTKCIREIYVDVRRKIVLSNETYKIKVEVYDKFKEYNVRDYVLVWIHL